MNNQSAIFKLCKLGLIFALIVIMIILAIGLNPKRQEIQSEPLLAHDIIYSPCAKFEYIYADDSLFITADLLKLSEPILSLVQGLEENEDAVSFEWVYKITFNCTELFEDEHDNEIVVSVGENALSVNDTYYIINDDEPFSNPALVLFAEQYARLNKDSEDNLKDEGTLFYNDYLQQVSHTRLGCVSYMGISISLKYTPAFPFENQTMFEDTVKLLFEAKLYKNELEENTEKSFAGKNDDSYTKPLFFLEYGFLTRPREYIVFDFYDDTLCFSLYCSGEWYKLPAELIPLWGDADIDTEYLFYTEKDYKTLSACFEGCPESYTGYSISEDEVSSPQEAIETLFGYFLDDLKEQNYKRRFRVVEV